MAKKMRKKLWDACIVLALMVVIAAMSALAAIVIMSMIPAAHADGFAWRHFGAAPFAKTRAEAMRNRRVAFVAFGMPPRGVVRLLMKVTESPGTPTTLVVGEKLTAMISKGGEVHYGVVVAFGSPVRHMQYAAPAEMWSVTWKGEVYTVYLPAICHNWAVVVTPSKCASVTFRVKPGVWVRFGVFTKNGERLPSRCWSLTDGNIVSAAPSPCTVCNWIGPLGVLPAGFRVEYSGLYRAHSRTQTLRFPREVTKDYIVLCVTRAGQGESDSWIIPPKVWHGNTIMRVPYGGARWPVWGMYTPHAH